MARRTVLRTTAVVTTSAAAAASTLSLTQSRAGMPVDRERCPVNPSSAPKLLIGSIRVCVGPIGAR